MPEFPSLRFSRWIHLAALPTALFCSAPPAAHAQFALGLGGTSGDVGRAIAVDDADNVYLTGYFNDTVDFDPGPGLFELTATGGVEAAFIASYDAQGALRYAVSFRGEGEGIAVDDAGNVFVTGFLGSGAVDVDPGPDEVLLVQSEGKAFVASYDGSGNLRFGFNVGGGVLNRLEKGTAIALDDVGNVYVTGTFNEKSDFDPTVVGEVLVDIEGLTDSYVASYTNTGGLRWAFGLGSRFSEDGLGLATDGAGNLWVSGSFSDSLDFDPGPDVDLRLPTGSRDIYVASYDSGGDYRFAVTVGGTSNDFGQAVAVDAAGNCFVTGGFRNSIDFDPGPGTLTVTSSGNQDCFLASYTDTGDLRFAFGLGSANDMLGSGVVVDAAGLPYLTGSFTNTVDFDPGPGVQSLSGAFDAFVAGYTSGGDYRLAYQYVDVGNPAEAGYGITTDSMNRLYVIGAFNGTADFDPGAGTLSLTSNGNDDVFFTRDDAAPVSAPTLPRRPALAELGPATPNPATGVTRLQLAVREAGPIRVTVHDVTGRLVATLLDGELPAGDRRTLEFDGEELPSGRYFVRVSDPGGESARSVVLLR